MGTSVYRGGGGIHPMDRSSNCQLYFATCAQLCAQRPYLESFHCSAPTTLCATPRHAAPHCATMQRVHLRHCASRCRIPRCMRLPYGRRMSAWLYYMVLLRVMGSSETGSNPLPNNEAPSDMCVWSWKVRRSRLERIPKLR